MTGHRQGAVGTPRRSFRQPSVEFTRHPRSIAQVHGCSRRHRALTVPTLPAVPETSLEARDAPGEGDPKNAQSHRTGLVLQSTTHEIVQSCLHLDI